MHNYSANAKGIYCFILFAALGISAAAAQGEQLYFVDSSGHCTYQTGAQIDAAFRACVQTPSGWQPVDKAAIWSTAPEAKTFVFVHGNMTDRHGAMEDAALIRSYLNGAYADKNYKLVIWFWDSARTRLPLRQDAINSERRSMWEGFYLARFLQSAPSEARIGLIGYSFGANTVLGACQLIASGSVFGQTAPGASGQMDAILIAPAVPSAAFLTGTNGWGKSLDVLSRCDVTLNEADSALKWYRFVAPDGQSEAMGRAGVAGVPLAQQGKVFFYNVTCQVGHTHALNEYLTKSGVFYTFITR